MTRSPISLKTLASGKFDLLDAMSMDPRVTPSEFRVAYRLLQHANSETGRIFPAQERIADQCGLKGRQVRNCIAGLVEKGWLRHERSNRHLSNTYLFLADNVNAVIDRQTSLADGRAEQKRLGKWQPLTGKKLPLRNAGEPDLATIGTGNILPLTNALTGNGLPVSTGNILPVLTGNGLPPNTLSITPEGNTCDSQGSEEVVVVTGTTLTGRQAASEAPHNASAPPPVSAPTSHNHLPSSLCSISPEENAAVDQQQQETPVPLEQVRKLMADANAKLHVIDEVVDLISGTKLDTPSYREKLRKLPPNDQVTAAKRDLAHVRRETKAGTPESVSDAVARLIGSLDRKVARR